MTVVVRFELCASLILFHCCFAELFQDLSQLQEIWIAEGGLTFC